MLFKVDYLITDVDAFHAAGVDLPTYVVAKNINDALEKANAYVNDNTSLLRCDLLFDEGLIVVTDNYGKVA